jgi:hypothetical protein
VFFSIFWRVCEACFVGGRAEAPPAGTVIEAVAMIATMLLVRIVIFSCLVRFKNCATVRGYDGAGRGR